MRAELEGNPADCETLGLALAADLREQGAEDILAQIG